jgi:formylmethanofuran dehydrogenase subunit B
MADRQASSTVSLTIIADAACTACGCVCDDIELRVDGDQIVEAKRACPLGELWFFERRDTSRPVCLIDGEPATLEEGIERAAKILSAAKYPLVYGLGGSACEAQRVAVGIADWIGGNLDTATSADHGPTGVSFQGVGEVTSSLGEVANRSDLVLFWGCDPVESHPRHTSRYSLEPHGMFVPNGRKDRTCIVVDVQKTKTAEEADVYLEIKPHGDFEALWTLRALANGTELDAAQIESETGVPLAAWQDLMARMKHARFGAIFFGRGLSQTHGRYLNTEALWSLVRDMNAHTRFVAMPLRAAGNVTGADNAICWQTGYPFAVNLSRGYPRYNPGEYTATELLARGEVDAALVVTSDPISTLDPTAAALLTKIPLVTIDSQETLTSRAAAVSFTTATPGIHTAGTVYRMDDVSIPLRPALKSNYPSDYEVLAALERRVRELKNSQGGTGILPVQSIPARSASEGNAPASDDSPSLALRASKGQTTMPQSGAVQTQADSAKRRQPKG